MRQRYFRAFFILLLLFSCNQLFAITDEELFRNFQFSFVNPGARSSAMGGAFIALADDATAAEANPAGLTILVKPEVSLEYRNTRFDEQRLNTFLFDPSIDFSVTSQFDTKELNRPSFISLVYPTKNGTYAFSRQEAVHVDQGINNVFNAGGLSLGGGALGTQDLKVTNYNFSVASKLSTEFSVGVSLRYSRLDWKTDVFNAVFISNIPAVTFTTALDQKDSAFAFNIGAVYDIGPRFSMGAVYKKNPKFEVQEVQSDVSGFFNATFTNVLKIPDSFGFGIAIKPNDNMRITSDIVRIEYSGLTEGFQAGHNVLLAFAGFGNDDVIYTVDDAVEYHIGAEFFVFLKNIPIALRQGYYRKSASNLQVASCPGCNEAAGDLKILALLFPPVEDENHFTLGNGVVLGNLQVDWALDLANTSDVFVLSTVVRF